VKALIAILALAAWFTLPAIANAADDLPPGVSADGSISLPANDFRKNWSYLGTFSIAGDDGAAELHVVYTQPESVKHYRQTGRFPDGAVIVKELFEAETEDLTTGRSSRAGNPVGWFVMVKDEQERFPGNPLWGHGWGWAFFTTDDTAKTSTTDYQQECLGCHVPAQDTDYIYTRGYHSLRGKGH
jgi:hypothetical protein